MPLRSPWWTTACVSCDVLKGVKGLISDLRLYNKWTLIQNMRYLLLHITKYPTAVDREEAVWSFDNDGLKGQTEEVRISPENVLYKPVFTTPDRARALTDEIVCTESAHTSHKTSRHGKNALQWKNNIDYLHRIISYTTDQKRIQWGKSLHRFTFYTAGEKKRGFIKETVCTESVSAWRIKWSILTEATLCTELISRKQIGWKIIIRETVCTASLATWRIGWRIIEEAVFTEMVSRRQTKEFWLSRETVCTGSLYKKD